MSQQKITNLVVPELRNSEKYSIYFTTNKLNFIKTKDKQIKQQIDLCFDASFNPVQRNSIFHMLNNVALN